MTVRELCAKLNPEENGDLRVFVRAAQFLGEDEMYNEHVIVQVERRMEPDTAVAEVFIHCAFAEPDDD